jgi:hypothetical protein
MNKQVRVSDRQYRELMKIAETFDINKSEVLNNAIGLLKRIVDERAKDVIILTKNGEEKEIFLAFMSGWLDEG